MIHSLAAHPTTSRFRIQLAQCEHFASSSTVMGDHDAPSTCVSSQNHGNNVRDAFLHYSGCLRGVARQAFFESLGSDAQRRIADEEKRIQNLRATFDENSAGTSGLARQFKQSLDLWRREKLRRFPAWSSSDQETPIDITDEVNQSTPCKPDLFGLHSNMIFFRSGRRFDDVSCPHEEFPNQKISLQELLYEKDPAKNPLSRPCANEEIRYFHLPANNMEWAEVSHSLQYLL